MANEWRGVGEVELGEGVGWPNLVLILLEMCIGMPF